MHSDAVHHAGVVARLQLSCSVLTVSIQKITPLSDCTDASWACAAGKGVLNRLQSSDFLFNALLPVNASGEAQMTLSLVAQDGSLGGSYAGTVIKVRLASAGCYQDPGIR